MSKNPLPLLVIPGYYQFVNTTDFLGNPVTILQVSLVDDDYVVHATVAGKPTFFCKGDDGEALDPYDVDDYRSYMSGSYEFKPARGPYKDCELHRYSMRPSVLTPRARDKNKVEATWINPVDCHYLFDRDGRLVVTTLRVHISICATDGLNGPLEAFDECLDAAQGDSVNEEELCPRFVAGIAAMTDQLDILIEDSHPDAPGVKPFVPRRYLTVASMLAAEYGRTRSARRNDLDRLTTIGRDLQAALRSLVADANAPETWGQDKQ